MTNLKTNKMLWNYSTAFLASASFLILFFHSVSSLAESAVQPNEFEELQLPDEGILSEKSEVEIPVEYKVQKDPAQDVSLEADQKTISIWFQGGWSYDAYHLNVNRGFSTGLPPRSGSLFGAEVTGHPKNKDFQFFASYKEWKSTTNNIPFLSPNSLTHKERLYIAGSNIYLFSGLENLGLQFAYFYRSTDPTITNPVAVMTEQRKHGFLVGAKYKWQISNNFNLENKFRVYLPIFFKEPAATTGRHSFSSGFEFETTVFYAISRYVELGLGLGFLLEYSWFDGTGSRNSTEAFEKRYLITAPASLRFSF